MENYSFLELREQGSKKQLKDKDEMRREMISFLANKQQERREKEKRKKEKTGLREMYLRAEDKCFDEGKAAVNSRAIKGEWSDMSVLIQEGCG